MDPRKTLAAYRLWVTKFQAFVRSSPTDQLGSDEVRGFLTELAVRHGVAASTQNQAFNALLFFYRHVLRREFGQLDGVVRAKRHRCVPVVLSHAETEAILGELQPPYRLVGLLLYGCGLRLLKPGLSPGPAGRFMSCWQPSNPQPPLKWPFLLPSILLPSD